MRAQREDGAAQDKTGDDDRGEIVDEPMKQIGGGIPPPFLLDQAVRLKNKIGQQMGQVDRQKGAKEELHVYVQVSIFVRFRATSKKSAGLTILPPEQIGRASCRERVSID